jgi:hypothetical protein
MKKPKPIFILVICSLIPLLFTATIPYAIPARLHMNSTKHNDHSWTGEIKLYIITLEEGSQYSIVVNTDSFWGMDVSLRIGETPYMINGFSVDSGSSSGENMHFTALKSGEYYIQMRANSGSGFFDITVESGTIGSATGSNEEFFDFLYLLVLILPSVLIVALGLLVLRRRASYPERKPTTINIYKRVKKEEKAVLVNEDILAKKEDVMICEYCGSEINKYLKKCPNCHASLQ